MAIAAEIRNNILTIAAAYRKATGLSLATVSARFYGNAGFLSEFKAGRQTISIDKLEEMVAKFRAEWPKDAIWPYLNAMFLDRAPAKRRQRKAEERVPASG